MAQGTESRVWRRETVGRMADLRRRTVGARLRYPKPIA